MCAGSAGTTSPTSSPSPTFAREFLVRGFAFVDTEKIALHTCLAYIVYVASPRASSLHACSLFRFYTVSLARTQNGAQKCTKVVRDAAPPGRAVISTFFFCKPPPPRHETVSPLLPLTLSRGPFTCLYKLRERARIARSVHTCIYLWRQIKITVRPLRHVNCHL